MSPNPVKTAPVEPDSASPAPLPLAGKRVGIVIAAGYHEHEYWFPYYRFREAGAEVVTAGPDQGIVLGEGRHGLDGLRAEVTHTVEDLAASELDAVYLPGGIYSPLALRMHQPTLDLVRRTLAADRIVAAICHAPWILIAADVVRGRRIACPPDIAMDVQNAGGLYVEDRAVRDGKLFTSVYFAYLPEQFRQLIPALAGPA